MKKFFFALLALAFATTFQACHNHDEDDANPPILTIESPTEGAVLSGEVHIKGKTTDESLHEMEIKVTNDATGAEYLKAAPEVHDETEYSFDEHFTPTGLTGETAVTLVITVEDHSDHVTTKTVKFKVKP